MAGQEATALASRTLPRLSLSAARYFGSHYINPNSAPSCSRGKPGASHSPAAPQALRLWAQGHLGAQSGAEQQGHQLQIKPSPVQSLCTHLLAERPRAKCFTALCLGFPLPTAIPWSCHRKIDSTLSTHGSQSLPEVSGFDAATANTCVLTCP